MLICPCFLIRAQERECWCVSAHRDRGLIKVDRVMLHAARDLTTHRSGRPDEQRVALVKWRAVSRCTAPVRQREQSTLRPKAVEYITPVGQEIPLPPLFFISAQEWDRHSETHR
jgi:hypothetical protein